MSIVVLQLLVLTLFMLVIPVVVGSLFPYWEKEGCLVFRWVSGQFLLWAGFQLISVPLILKQQSFLWMVWLFLGYTAAMAALAAAVVVRRRKKGAGPFFRLPGMGGAKGWKGGEGTLLWLAFWGLLLFQLVQAVRLAYEDSDDAYYVAVASIAESSDTMFRVLPYTGGATLLDARHGLAPFSIWMAFLARVSGMRTVILAQTVLLVALIAMAYGIYYLFSVRLFPEKGGQRPLFLIFAEILVLFGNYSVYTTEVFLIGRSRQGKASLGSIVFPFVLLISLMLFQKLQERKKVPVGYYLLLAAAAAAGCLCSTMGAMLTCILIGIVGLLTAVFYRKWKTMLLLAVCCIPCIVYGFLYLVLA